MRVAVGGVWHETNTFVAGRTARQDFEVHEGAALLENFRGTKTPIGGFLDGAREAGLEIVPGLFASAVPSGTVERAAYEDLTTRCVRSLADARPDGILLDLHGAMVAEGIEEVETDLARRIRGRLGTLPVAAVLDFHANVPDSLPALLAFCGYDTYPHVDPYDRGVEAALLLGRQLRREIAPVGVRFQPRLITVPQSQKTDAPPMRDLLDLAREAEGRRGVLSVTVSGGFAYADVPHAGLSVTAFADGSEALARDVAREIGRRAWERRDAFRVRNVSPAEAVARALRAPAGPVVLVDQADNIGGGCPGDGTALLGELVRARAAGAVVTIADPEVVALAWSAGEGATVEASLGGKTDSLHGAPVPVRARVVRVGNGDFSYKGSYMTNRRVTAGRAALLEVEGVRVVARERKVMPFDRQEVEVLGVDPARATILVVKSALAWRAAYGDLAKAVIEVDTPGACTARIETLPYRRVRRPVAPLDPEVTE
jgi:microcystin degradation protein MlrC